MMPSHSLLSDSPCPSLALQVTSWRWDGRAQVAKPPVWSCICKLWTWTGFIADMSYMACPPVTSCPLSDPLAPFSSWCILFQGRTAAAWGKEDRLRTDGCRLALGPAWRCQVESLRHPPILQSLGSSCSKSDEQSWPLGGHSEPIFSWRPQK